MMSLALLKAFLDFSKYFGINSNFKKLEKLGNSNKYLFLSKSLYGVLSNNFLIFPL